MDEIESDILIAEPEEEVVDEEIENENAEEIKSNAEDDNISNLFEYKSAPMEENKTIKKETDAFVNYNNNNLNKVYKKYDVVKTYVPKKHNKQKKNNEFEKYVIHQSGYVPEKETFVVERKSEKPKFKLKRKVKVWLVSISIIFAMLGGLSIYNAVHISNLNREIEQTTTSINNVNNDIKQVVKNIDVLTDEDNVLEKADELGLKEIPEEDKVTIQLNEKNEVKEYESQTNFFDKICNFFRGLFGG